jgi:hypothetical protein
MGRFVIGVHGGGRHQHRKRRHQQREGKWGATAAVSTGESKD